MESEGLSDTAPVREAVTRPPEPGGVLPGGSVPPLGDPVTDRLAQPEARRSVLLCLWERSVRSREEGPECLGVPSWEECGLLLFVPSGAQRWLGLRWPPCPSRAGLQGGGPMHLFPEAQATCTTFSRRRPCCPLALCCGKSLCRYYYSSSKVYHFNHF